MKPLSLILAVLLTAYMAVCMYIEETWQKN